MSVATKLHLTFSTSAGDLEDDFPLHQPLRAAKREVMARLKLDEGKADEMVVVFQGNVLDETKALGELGLPENAVLTIERRELVKI